MEFETKFMRLWTPVTLSSRFGDWQVCWVGGWNKHRIGFMVMVVRVSPWSPSITPAVWKLSVAAKANERERTKHPVGSQLPLTCLFRRLERSIMTAQLRAPERTFQNERVFNHSK
jgi:hypothetical protein